MKVLTAEEWQQFVENVKDKADRMWTNAMDYDTIWYFYHQIKNGQIPINKMIQDYGETHFRELIDTLKPRIDH